MSQTTSLGANNPKPPPQCSLGGGEEDVLSASLFSFQDRVFHSTLKWSQMMAGFRNTHFNTGNSHVRLSRGWERVVTATLQGHQKPVYTTEAAGIVPGEGGWGLCSKPSVLWSEVRWVWGLGASQHIIGRIQPRMTCSPSDMVQSSTADAASAPASPCIVIASNDI